MLIPTKAAREQGLPGSDVYIGSHLLYHDDLNRDAGVVGLNVEALRALADTITVGRRGELEAESKQRAEFRGRTEYKFGDWSPVGNAHWDLMEFHNYECLKIACAFELHLKARLAERDFIVHEIASSASFKKLHDEQRKRPIKRQELFEITEYYFDGTINLLPGITDRSLKFSQIVDSPNYVNALEITDQMIAVIREYRSLRNMIHLPGDLLSTPYLSSLQRPIAEILVEFFRSDVLEHSEALIVRADLNPAQLVRFRALVA